MAKGILVNLGEIDSIADKYSDNGNIMQKINECNGKLYAVKNHYKYHQADVYKVQKDNISELSASIRSLVNNFEDISTDLKKYVKKMEEGDIVKFDSDVFVAKDHGEVEKKINYLSLAISEMNELLKTKIQGHELVESGFDMINIEKEEDGICSIDFTKKQEVDEMKNLNSTFIENMTTCIENKNVSEYLRIAREQNKAISDWYDRDFDASDHAVQVAKFTGTVVLEIATIAAVTALEGPVILGVIVFAGMEGTYRAVVDYENGSTGKEATIAGGKVMFWDILLGGLSGGVAALRSTGKEALEEVAEKAIKNNKDEIVEKGTKAMNSVSENTIEDGIDALKKLNIDTDELIQLSLETTVDSTRDEGIEEFVDYINENSDLDVSIESIEILIAVFSEGA